MRYFLLGCSAAALFGAVAALFTALLGQSATTAAPDPISCAGYPEARVYVSSQAWWTRFPGQTGTDFGHVHQEACIPERQPMTSDFDIDLRLIMHDNPGTYSSFDLVTKGVGYETTVQSFTVPGFTCPVGTCERWLHFTIHMSEFQESGLQEVRFRTFVNTPDGNKMHASTNWQVYINNGRPRSDVSRFPFLRNKGWYGDNPLAGYCEAGFTSALLKTSVSGRWTPTVRIVTHSTDASFPVTQHTVTLDPDFHAMPPVLGTVLKQGAGGFEGPVTIDTTKLANGTHKLHLRADCDAGNSTNSGVGVIFFRVQNGSTPPATPTPTPATAVTATATPTATPMATPTASATTAPTATATRTPTPTAMATATRTPTPTATATRTATATVTPTATVTRTPTPKATDTATATPTAAVTPTAAATAMPAATATPTATSNAAPTATTPAGTDAPTPTETQTPTATPISTPPPTATATPSPTPTDTPTPIAPGASAGTETPMPTETETITTTSSPTTTPEPPAATTATAANTAAVQAGVTHGVTLNRVLSAVSLPNTGGPFGVSSDLLLSLAGGIVIGVGLTAVLAKTMLRPVSAASAASATEAYGSGEDQSGRRRGKNHEARLDGRWYFILAVGAAALVAALLSVLSDRRR